MITSASNPTLKLVRKLLAQKRKREELGLFAVEGEDLVAAASAAGIEPVELLVAGENVEPELLAAISTLAHPARVVALYRTAALPREQRETTLALWRVADPGNMGTLLRAADAFGAAVAISAGCADPLGPKALRASAGAIFRVPLLAWDDAPGERVALVAHGGTPLHELELAGGPVTFLLGAEREGLPEDVVAQSRQGRLDRDPGRGRVAQRRRRGRDRALRALAPLGSALEEPLDRCGRGRRRGFVPAAEAAVGDVVAGLAQLGDDGVGALDREDGVERAVRDEDAWDAVLLAAEDAAGRERHDRGKEVAVREAERERVRRAV